MRYRYEPNHTPTAFVAKYDVIDGTRTPPLHLVAHNITLEDAKLITDVLNQGEADGRARR